MNFEESPNNFDHFQIKFVKYEIRNRQLRIIVEALNGNFIVYSQK